VTLSLPLFGLQLAYALEGSGDELRPTRSAQKQIVGVLKETEDMAWEHGTFETTCYR
jgi:hypothetical protein